MDARCGTAREDGPGDLLPAVRLVACEAAFWTLVASGPAARYLLRRPRTGLVLLAATPVLDVVLLAVTAVDLRRGGEPGWAHGLGAL